MASVPSYVNSSLLREIGLESLPDEQKQQLLDQMNELVHKRTLLRILQLLPEDVKESFTEIESLSTAEQLKKLVLHVPNIAELVVEEIEKVKGEMKAIVAGQ